MLLLLHIEIHLDSIYLLCCLHMGAGYRSMARCHLATSAIPCDFEDGISSGWSSPIVHRLVTEHRMWSRLFRHALFRVGLTSLEFQAITHRQFQTHRIALTLNRYRLTTNLPSSPHLTTIRYLSRIDKKEQHNRLKISGMCAYIPPPP